MGKRVNIPHFMLAAARPILSPRFGILLASPERDVLLQKPGYYNGFEAR